VCEAVLACQMPGKVAFARGRYSRQQDYDFLRYNVSATVGSWPHILFRHFITPYFVSFSVAFPISGASTVRPHKTFNTTSKVRFSGKSLKRFERGRNRTFNLLIFDQQPQINGFNDFPSFFVVITRQI
jgi:hypothetical protein